VAMNASDLRTQANLVFQIDVNKANRIFDFMIHSGWIAKA